VSIPKWLVCSSFLGSLKKQKNQLPTYFYHGKIFARAFSPKYAAIDFRDSEKHPQTDMSL